MIATIGASLFASLWVMAAVAMTVTVIDTKS